MKIVFMGTPDFAVPCLRRLLDDGQEVIGVYTQPDKPKGRGHKLAPSPVKEEALLRGIPVFQPRSMRTGEAAEQLRGLNPELLVVVAYGKILPQEILDIPPYGCINVHASLLPKYRGAGPIQWSILRGESETGVTTMQMDAGIDTGDMLLSRATPIGENETAEELSARLSALGADLLAETLIQLEAGQLHPQKQDEAAATHAPMLDKGLSKLDFARPAVQLHNQIRGLSPWPGAECLYQKKRLKIYRSEIVHTNTVGQPGEILAGKDFVVACGEGALRLVEVQYEGSKRMPGADFLRGRRPNPGECLEKGD
jgi:methionyl-tRNA formyltransferase